ncbi:MAG: dephospho-CoA kinase [Paracoccaceae bacterium]
MKPFYLGLTGSIGMGKSTTAAFFAAEYIPVWDADAAVHRLYAAGGAAVAPIVALCPDALENGGINRLALKDKIAQDHAFLAALEAIVHPLVAKDRAVFLASAQSDILVLDIPILFEKGTETELDATLLVTAPPALQRARVMARPGMTEAQFHTILSRQMPDTEKRARATHIIETLGLEAAHQAVLALIAYIRETRNA